MRVKTVTIGTKGDIGRIEWDLPDWLAAACTNPDGTPNDAKLQEIIATAQQFFIALLSAERSETAKKLFKENIERMFTEMGQLTILETTETKGSALLRSRFLC